MQINKPKLAVIGAGIAGLNLANLMSEMADVTVFEKSGKLGGRIATHASDGCTFDHGAQFFTAKSPRFKQFAQELQAKGVIARWDANFVEMKGTEIKAKRNWDESYPHYVGSPDMNAIGRHMAKNLDVRFNQHVESVQRDGDAWLIKSSSIHMPEPFDWVVFALPAAQAQMLLPTNCQFYADLQTVKMQSCFCLMLGYEIPQPIGWDAAIIAESILSWASINSSKPNRGDTFTLVTMSKNDWADAHFHESDSFVINAMLAELSRVIGCDMTNYSYLKLKHWKYANAPRRLQPGTWIDNKLQLACCGDWCNIGRIESAFTSSADLAEKIKAIL